MEAISNRVGPQTHHGEGVFSAFLKGPDGQLLEVESLWPELLCEVPRVPAAGPTPADLRQQITFIYTDDLAASEKFYSKSCALAACCLCHDGWHGR